MNVPLTAVAQLENSRMMQPDNRMRVAGDVEQIPTEKNLTALQWQFLKSLVPILGRGMDSNAIRRQVWDTKNKIDSSKG